MFIPLNFLFFLLTTDLTVQQVGYGTSLATLLSLPVAPLAGIAVDRWGPKASLVANNLISTVGFLCYLLVDSQASLVVVLFVVLCAERLYWVAWPAFVADLAEGRSSTGGTRSPPPGRTRAWASAVRPAAPCWAPAGPARPC